MQREAVTVMQSCHGMIFIPLTIVSLWVMVILKEPFLDGGVSRYFFLGASALHD
jgi:hypothetical protein